MNEKEKFTAILTTKHYIAIIVFLTIIVILSTKFQIVLLGEEISWRTFMPFVIIYVAIFSEWMFKPIQRLIRKSM